METVNIYPELLTVSVSVSVLTLTVISVERWYAICFPLRFKATTARAKRLVLFIWMISLIIDIPELIVLETKPRGNVKVETIYFTQCGPSWGFEWDIAHIILRTLLLYAIPLTFMSFAYYQIVRVLWSSANIPGNSSGRRQQTVVVNGNGSSHNHVQCQAQWAHMSAFTLHSPPGFVQSMSSSQIPADTLITFQNACSGEY